MTKAAQQCILDPAKSSDAEKAAVLAELIGRTSLGDADFAALIGYRSTRISELLCGGYPIRPEVLLRAAEMSDRACRALRPLRSFSRREAAALDFR